MKHPSVGDQTITLAEYKAMEEQLDRPLTWGRAWYHRSQRQVADDNVDRSGGKSATSGGRVAIPTNGHR